MYMYIYCYINTLYILFIVEVLKAELEEAQRIYNQEREKIQETIAFGRRSEGPPMLYYPTKEKSHLTRFGKRKIIRRSGSYSFVLHFFLKVIYMYLPNGSALS